MVLNAPGDRTVGANFGALHIGNCIGGKHCGAWREGFDLVEMHGRSIKDVELAGIQRMFAARLGEPDAAAKADLTALGVLPHAATRRRGNDLKAPARTENWCSGL